LLARGNRRRFKERGMDWVTFRLYAPGAEVFVVGDSIFEAKIWKDFLGGDW
jgi:hypothetical protein